MTLLSLLEEHWKELNADSICLTDTFPIAACDNYRIPRCRLYQVEPYRSDSASKKRSYYGLKVHLLVTQAGQPVEFFLTPGADNDVGCLDLFDFDLPEGSAVYADRIYNDYLLESIYQEAGIRFQPLRKKNLNALSTLLNLLETPSSQDG